MGFPKQPGTDAEAHLSAVHKVLELTRANKRLEAELAEARAENQALEHCLEEKREAIEALGEHPVDSDLWATMKRQRDKALEQLAEARGALRQCLSVFAHPNFTDRHGMADICRAALPEPEPRTAKGSLD